MAHTPESIQKVLKEIQSKVPQIIRDKIVKKVELTPTIKKIATEALEAGSTREELKSHLKGLLDSGQLDKFKFEENKKYSKMANDIVSREINKAIRQGRLPKRVDVNKILHEKNNS